MKLPKILSLFLIVYTSCLSFSQIAVETPEPSYIKTIQFRGDTFLGELPTIKLGDPLQLSFDDIIGDEHDYYYFVDRIGDTFRWKAENVATNEVAGVTLFLIPQYQGNKSQ